MMDKVQNVVDVLAELSRSLKDAEEDSTLDQYKAVIRNAREDIEQITHDLDYYVTGHYRETSTY